MAHATRPVTAPRHPRALLSVDRKTLQVGLIASIAFGMIEMLIESAIGQGFWSPVRYIAAVFTHGADTDPGFAAVPVMVGLIGHMMNSVIFGMLFATMTRRLRDPFALTAAGMIYGAVIFTVMWFAVLPSVDPAMKLLDGPGFLFSHVMYGVVLGVGLAAVRGRVDPAGRI